MNIWTLVIKNFIEKFYSLRYVHFRGVFKNLKTFSTILEQSLKKIIFWFFSEKSLSGGYFLLVDGHKVLCKPHNIQWRSETHETGLYGLRNNRFGTSDRAVWSLAARVRSPCLKEQELNINLPCVALSSVSRIRKCPLINS